MRRVLALLGILQKKLFTVKVYLVYRNNTIGLAVMESKGWEGPSYKETPYTCKLTQLKFTKQPDKTVPFSLQNGR